jgi:superfamily II DNA or RNA helicase
MRAPTAETIPASAGCAAPLAVVRRAIAAAFLGDAPTPRRVGRITLHPHQLSAVGRIRRKLADHGGALLCDDVGLGKTYVALAVAASYDPVTVIAPAALADMWRHALEMTGMEAEFISVEALGRAGAPERRRVMLIVDEAHHFRNPCTRRYSALARMCAVAPVLLLTATPLHNSRDDLSAIVALFVGSRAYAMSDAELAPMVVRRAAGDRDDQRIPIVEHAPATVVIASEALLDRILALPAPVPPSDGSVATRLVIHGLVRQWASSNAALIGALKRRIARSHGLLASLDAGRYPSAAELAAWVYTGDAVQLAFAELLLPAATPLATLAGALRTHVGALTSLLALARSRDDAALTDFVRAVRRAHPNERIVAFSCYAETAEALYRSLRNDGHVALLTARGAMIASGPVPREEILTQFAPRAQPSPVLDQHQRVTLLVATDLLSEGVNLQDASVVIHLDLPWTAARIEQRIGRLARMGSPHQRVISYAIEPPPRAEAFLHELEIIARKSDVAARVFGTPSIERPPDRTKSGAIASGEATRRIIDGWRYDEMCADENAIRPIVAVAAAQRRGALGLWLVDGTPMLLACDESDCITEDGALVERAVRAADVAGECGTRTELEPASTVMRSATDWYDRRRAWEATGVISGAESGSSMFGKGSRDMRRSIARVADATSASASFARRSESAAIATRLRNAAALPLPLAVEWSLENLSDCADEAAVTTILDLVDRARPAADRVIESGFTCLALILFVPPAIRDQ